MYKSSLKSRKKVNIRKMGKGPNISFIEGRQPKDIRKCVNLVVLKVPNRLVRVLKTNNTCSLVWDSMFISHWWHFLWHCSSMTRNMLPHSTQIGTPKDSLQGMTVMFVKANPSAEPKCQWVGIKLSCRHVMQTVQPMKGIK